MTEQRMMPFSACNTHCSKNNDLTKSHPWKHSPQKYPPQKYPPQKCPPRKNPPQEYPPQKYSSILVSVYLLLITMPYYKCKITKLK